MGNCIIFDRKEWEKEIALFIQKKLIQISKYKASINVMLTGGRTASQLYRELYKIDIFRYFEFVDIFLSDERIVPPDHPDSNFGLIHRELFNKKLPENVNLYSVDVLNPSVCSAASKYHNELPDWFDLILLALGDDGHIASLFPEQEIESHENKYVYIGKQKNHFRYSATHYMLNRSSLTLILVVGNEKTATLNRLLKSKSKAKYPSLKLNNFKYLVVKDND